MELNKYLHHRWKSLLLPCRFKCLVHCHQEEKLHLILCGHTELEEHPLEDPLGFITEGGTEQSQAGRSLLPELLQELTTVRPNRTHKNMWSGTAWILTSWLYTTLLIIRLFYTHIYPPETPPKTVLWILYFFNVISLFRPPFKKITFLKNYILLTYLSMSSVEDTRTKFF